MALKEYSEAGCEVAACVGKQLCFVTKAVKIADWETSVGAETEQGLRDQLKMKKECISIGRVFMYQESDDLLTCCVVAGINMVVWLSQRPAVPLAGSSLGWAWILVP